MSKNNDSETCVILVCVTNKQNKVLTHDKFFKIFSAFGEILRILIFERAVIWKTFVEFDSTESAVQARNSMNGTDFGDDGMKMQVYAGQLETITFQENNSGGVDYTILRQKIDQKNLNQTQKQVFSSPMQFTHSYNSIQQNKSFSQSSSPLYGKNSLQMQNQKTILSNSTQIPFGQPHQFTQSNSFQGTISTTYKSSFSQASNTINHHFDMIQLQMNLYQSIQQQVQRTNHLMYMLMQVNSEQQYHAQIQNFSQTNSEHYLQLIARQQQLVKDLSQTQTKTNNQLDQYQSFLSKWHNMWNKQGQQSGQKAFPIFGQISQIESLVGSMGTTAQIHNTDDQKKVSMQAPSESSPLKVSNNFSNIIFIKTYDEVDENQKNIDNLLNDDDWLVNQAGNEFKVELNNSKNLLQIQTKPQIDKDSQKFSNSDYEYEDEDQKENEEERQQSNDIFKTYDSNVSQNKNNDIDDKQIDLFDCFQSKNVGDTFDTKHILSKLNDDIKGVDDNSQQSLLAMLESQIQLNTKQQSSTSVDQIDQLINSSKLKQQQFQMRSGHTEFQQNFPNTQPNHWMNKDPQNQLYEDVTENLDPANYVNPLFMKVVRKSKVIYARWFDKKFVTLKMLANIFSTFGNIDKMIYLKQSSSALVQYQTIDHAAMSKDNLNDLMFYRQQIKIFYSNYEEIYLKNLDKDDMEEYYQGTDETHRFKDNHTYSFNPPSDTILVANLTRESCSQEKFIEIFEPFGKIIKHKQFHVFVIINRIVFHPSNRNSCSIKFENVETSLIILANLNGSLLDGRILLISFSKQRL